MKRNLTAKRGFSLVEVAMALAIAAFCLLTLMGLLSLGVHNYQQSGSRTTMVNLSTAVVQDLQAAPANSTANSLSPRFQFKVAFPGSGTASPTPQTAFVDANGVGMNGNGLGPTTVYRISVAFFPPAAGFNSATTARVIVSYPAQADPSTTVWPSNYTSMFETMVSLNRN